MTKFLYASLSFFPFISSCGTIQTTRTYRVTEFHIGDAALKVEIIKYAADEASKKSLIILAPTGGVTVLDKSFSRLFCKSGYDVYLVKNWTYDVDNDSTDLEVHQRLYATAQRAMGLVLDQIKSPFIGILATSVGALHAEVSAQMQERIDTIFVIVGGAPIADVIIHSDHKDMVRLKKQRYRRYGFKNDREYRDALDRAFFLEPMKLGTSHKKKDLGMSIATEDATVPTINQEELKDFWKPRLVLTHPSGHFWGIVKTWWFDDQKILQFFEESNSKKLSMQQTR